jgi:hypothetical protein
MHPRLIRERETILKMSYLYCRKVHQSPKGALCSDCQELIDYAFDRLDHCPFQENKPTCLKCTVHCYKPVMRDRVRQMMRHAGPMMMVHHPVLAFLHLAVDGRRKSPGVKRKTSS